MKIKSVTPDNRRKVFHVTIGRQTQPLPYARLKVRPTRQDPIRRVYVDPELAREGFTYELASGSEGTVHVEQVLEYNRDPRYLRDLLLYKLTLLAQQRMKASPLSKRELIRRLGTSPAQLYRLLDQTNYTKSTDQMVALLSALDCEIDLIVKRKAAHVRTAV